MCSTLSKASKTAYTGLILKIHSIIYAFGFMLSLLTNPFSHPLCQIKEGGEYITENNLYLPVQ